ncbi:MAG TPA: hypothetical protein VK474_05000 [Chthoniobacterales bacterium]|nr:hypothetical protein [Chthoniobacterales bacterium]
MKNKSTYSLLLNADSEDKGHSIFEAVVYGLVVACMALSGWHFASGTVTLPGQNRVQNPPQSMIANAPAPAAPVVEKAPLVASRG